MTDLSLVYPDALDIPFHVRFRLKHSAGSFEAGTIVERTFESKCNDEDSVGFMSYPVIVDSEGDPIWTYLGPEDLEPLEESPEQSIARPVLGERKTGKVQVHLLDQGFPNALLEVAKVMTWAGENKGYKPHDWKNLPDAENAFEGAASRHRMMHNIQRQSGMDLLECTDDESKIVHKAHEAFNVLAELELMLTGKIS